MTQAPVWQKSSFSGEQEAPNCLEFSAREDALLLRESDEPGNVIAASGAEVAALIRHLRARHT